MKIVGLKLENYRNIEFAELKLDENFNIVSGKNGAGKSSLIEAMIDAIKGKNAIGKNPDRKIKKGSDKAVIEVETDTLKIKRTITEKDVYLKAERIDGGAVSQSDLNSLFSDSTINITQMLHLDAKAQIEFVKEIANIDTSTVEEEYKDKYAARTFVNKQVKQKSAVVNDFGAMKEVKSVDISARVAEMNSIREANDEITAKLQEKQRYRAEAKARLEEVKKLEERAERARALADDALAKLNNIVASKESIVDYSDIVEEIENAKAINEKASRYQNYLRAKKELSEVEDEATDLNRELKELLAEREEIISKAKLPFGNIEFDKDLGVIIDKIPFSEHSSAEQIAIMAKLYSKQNPELKVIYIKDGSLLDSDTLKDLANSEQLGKYQFLIEMVGEKESSIIMREGRIVEEEK